MKTCNPCYCFFVKPHEKLSNEVKDSIKAIDYVLNYKSK